MYAITSSSRFLILAILTTALFMPTQAHPHPEVCGVAERWGCGGGACRVPGWSRGCVPKCAGRTVSCGRPVGRRNWWRAKRCHCSGGIAKCRMRCRRLKRRRCDWRQRLRYRYKPQWRRYHSKLHSFLRGRGKTKDDAHDHDQDGAWRWYRKPHWERYYAWVPVCRKQKFTKCFCPPNPCRCDRVKPSVMPTPSTPPQPMVSSSPSPSTTPIFTTVAASPIQPAPDTIFNANAPLDLP